MLEEEEDESEEEQSDEEEQESAAAVGEEAVTSVRDELFIGDTSTPTGDIQGCLAAIVSRTQRP